MKKIILSLSLLMLSSTMYSQTNTNIFPPNGAVGIGTLTPQAWFQGKVFQFKDERPILRLSPNSIEGLATILFKGAYDETAGTADEFHLNYVSSRTNPKIVISAYAVSGGATVFSILGNGNVGVGTETPNAKLAVAGNVNAREVKVSVNAGADFVFDDNYKPFTLDETEQFVKTNKHLPDIAPESEMLKEGINLSEMNIKLLQKIEELTLVLIEQNKRIKKLEAGKN